MLGHLWKEALMRLPLVHIVPNYIFAVPLELILYFNDLDFFSVKLFSQDFQLFLELLPFTLDRVVLIIERFVYVLVQILSVSLDFFHEALVCWDWGDRLSLEYGSLGIGLHLLFFDKGFIYISYQGEYSFKVKCEK